MSRRRHLAELFASGELTRLVKQHKTTRAVAAALGMERKALCSLMDRMRSAGELPGWDALAGGSTDLGIAVPNTGTNGNDMTRWPSVEAFDADVPLEPIPDGHVVHRITTQVGPDGETERQWIKTIAGEVDPVQILRLAFADGIPVEPLIAEPADRDDDLLAVYGLGDPHIGMLSWSDETGENFDLAIAERHIFEAVDRLARVAPAAKTALIVSVGDTLHSDGPRNQTTKGTPVDVDSRTPKMFATTLRAFKRIVYRALERHEEVHVKIARGNHDETLSMLVSISLAEHFEQNPRVHIDTSPAFFHWFRFGANFIGVTHGNRQKPMDMMGVMAATQARDWGETRHRRFYCGHYHHEMSKEVPGVIVDYLPTLAAKEAYAAAHGYIAARSMRCDVYHRERGLKNRHVVGVEDLT